MKMKILAIETSCDETAVALVKAAGGRQKPRFKVVKNLVSSQTEIHRPFGGVVPNLAKREHAKNLPLLFNKILNFKFPAANSADLIAVTVGPGLEPALWTGINFAKNLKYQIPNLKAEMIGVNHLEGHLYSFLLNPEYSALGHKNIFPAIALIASGGHTVLLLLKNLTRFQKLGETRDDAAGEAFDKTARLLGLPYPGGPELEKLARRGRPQAVAFPRPMLNQKNCDFSFSGLKTAVLYYLRDRRPPGGLSEQAKADVAASFQAAAVEVLVEKTVRAALENKVRSVILCGGVAANKVLRTAFKERVKKIGLKFLTPPPKFNTDNAAMIAAAGYLSRFRRKKLPLKADSGLGI